MRLFELLIGVLVLAVLGSFAALVVRVGPNWSEVFRDFLPNPGILRPGGLYAAVGIIGATVQPNALFLGSKLATVVRYDEDDEEVCQADETILHTAQQDAHSYGAAGPRLRSVLGPSLHLPHPARMPAPPLRSPMRGPSENYASGGMAKPLGGIKQLSVTAVPRHVNHASVDIAMSLMCFALVINAAILIVSATAFNVNDEDVVNGDLFSAHALIRERLGNGALPLPPSRLSLTCAQLPHTFSPCLCLFLVNAHPSLLR